MNYFDARMHLASHSKNQYNFYKTWIDFNLNLKNKNKNKNTYI